MATRTVKVPGPPWVVTFPSVSTVAIEELLVDHAYTLPPPLAV